MTSLAMSACAAFVRSDLDRACDVCPLGRASGWKRRPRRECVWNNLKNPKPLKKRGGEGPTMRLEKEASAQPMLYRGCTMPCPYGPVFRWFCPRQPMVSSRVARVSHNNSVHATAPLQGLQAHESRPLARASRQSLGLTDRTAAFTMTLAYPRNPARTFRHV